jgi:large-conductance mechanosensitive channel
MINTKHLLKVGAAWISIVYVICYVGVALFPGIRSAFMKNALHTSMDMGQNVMTFGTFLSGLVIWNVIALVALWLFAMLYNRIKQ